MKLATYSTTAIVLLLPVSLLDADEAARIQAKVTGSPQSFVRDIAPLFSRLGCNAGSCHGAVQGQNGFRLSLFGANPTGDFVQIVRGAMGRRVSWIAASQSLLLLKGTGQIPHVGGRRMKLRGPEYQQLERWITAGCPVDEATVAQVTELVVTPANRTLVEGESYDLRVEARFADDNLVDVTKMCSFESRDPAVAAVNVDGHVTARNVGDAAVLVRYRQYPAISQVVVSRTGNSFEPEFARSVPHNFIDERILEKLRRLNVPPSDTVDDATFLRRIRLDVTGQLPTPDEIQEFLSSADSAKRVKKINELLNAPGYADLWTLKFCDLLGASDFGVYADGLSKEQDAPRFQAWVRARLIENTPYDEFASRILTATSREGRSLDDWANEVVELQAGYGSPRRDLDLYARRKTLDAYWQRKAAVGVSGTLQVAHSFLGLRLECAQCHRHPHDVWTQDDLLSFANFFMRVRKVGFHGQNTKVYPEEGKVFERFNAESKKLADEVKKRKAGDGKALAAKAKQAITVVNRLRSEIDRAEQQTRQLESQAVDLKQRATGIATQNAAEATRLKKDANSRLAMASVQHKLAAAKREELKPHADIVAKNDRVQKEISELDRRSKFLSGEVAKRVLHAQILNRTDADAVKQFASVTSPLGTQTSQEFRLLGESQPQQIAVDEDPRLKLVDWLRKPDNPFFAKAIVNRVWAHYFGRGIVDPPDDLSPLNPPTHPELLDRLCREFISNGYDLKWLHRTILSSRTYQQSAVPTVDNRVDRKNYAYFYVRRLPAEVLLDALNQATATTENMDMRYYHWPAELRTVEIPYMPRNSFVSFMLEQFGRPARNSSIQCDCERQSESSMLQVLSFANHPRVWAKINEPTGRVAKVMKQATNDEQQIQRLYLHSLSRLPNESELKACQTYLASSASRENGLRSILWSLINTKEFVLQH